MPLAAGKSLGPYELTSLLGSGGMGEVYRARDSRLGRDVAVKVLPEDVAADSGRAQRFEREARAASALNHPNIVSVFDIGSDSGVSYFVSELVEGESLRALIQRGPVPVRKLIDIAAQIADGLASAHGAGITHRDLKPDNVMITRDGRVKILDFGLAKQRAAPAKADVTATLAPSDPTVPGMVLGTAGYMSPEQVRGEAVDFRSDQFSFGIILYEMATARSAFRRESSVQTMSAILSEDPPPIESGVPGPLCWIIEQCLSKDAEDRYASTKDLYRDLRNLRDHLSDISASGAMAAMSAAKPKSRWLPVASIAVLVVAAGGAGAYFGRSLWQGTPPRFQALTFRRGLIDAARFAPDGKTVVYGAAWGEEPISLFVTRPGSPESTPMGLKNASVLGISSAGEVAASLGYTAAGAFIFTGTLSRVPMAGGAPREVLENVLAADWAPDANTFAVVREIKGRMRLEYPIGKPVFDSGGWISNPRVSPDGSRVAFLDHPTRGDDRGSVALVDRAGKKTVLSEGWLSEGGLAWHPSGKEVWFTATRTGSNRLLYAVNMSGGERVVAWAPGTMTLHDISADGRALITRDTLRMSIMALPPGGTRERDLSWLDWSLLRDLSNDGKAILFDETGEGGGPRHAVYFRTTDGAPAVRLGEGAAGTLSPDGKWAIATGQASSGIILLPTGAGEPKRVDFPGTFNLQSAAWFPDGRRLLLNANETGRGVRLYVVSLSEDLKPGQPRAITPEGTGSAHEISPDGKLVAAFDAERMPRIYPSDGGPSRTIAGARQGDQPVQWTPAGDALFVYQRYERKIYRISVASGKRELWKELVPTERAGLLSLSPVRMTPDGKAYAYSIFVTTSELYLVEGLK